MTGKLTNGQRLDSLEQKFDILIALMTGKAAPVPMEVATDFRNEPVDVEAPAPLALVPEPDVPLVRSELGQAFQARNLPPAEVPLPGGYEWEGIGDTPRVNAAPTISSAARLGGDLPDAHSMTDEQIRKAYQRDQTAKRQPGMTAEDEAAAARVRMG
jgi:hypothetical protein